MPVPRLVVIGLDCLTPQLALDAWRDKLPAGDTRRQGDARNIHLTGWLIARSALAREESRGAHYRTDFPAHDDARFKKHSVVRGEKVSFE